MGDGRGDVIGVSLAISTAMFYRRRSVVGTFFFSVTMYLTQPRDNIRRDESNMNTDDSACQSTIEITATASTPATVSPTHREEARKKMKYECVKRWRANNRDRYNAAQRVHSNAYYAKNKERILQKRREEYVGRSKMAELPASEKL